MTDMEQNFAKSGSCVNVGCGATPTPGWVNFDNSWTVRATTNPLTRLMFQLLGQTRGREEYLAAISDHDVRWANAARRIPVSDSSARVVYSSHMVEHLTRAEMRQFFAEAKRALTPGGRIRIAVPDIDYHVGLYKEHGDADILVGGLLMASEAPQGLVGTIRHLIVGERHHQWMYNGASMARELTLAGFKDAIVLPAGETGIADPGALDLHERAPESVFIEAVRP